MAIARSQISTAIPGKEMEFISLSKEGIKLMNDKGIPTGVRVSHSGTQDIEVYTVSMFDNFQIMVQHKTNWSVILIYRHGMQKL